MIRIKTQKNLQNWGNMATTSFMANFFHRLPRTIFRTQSKVYGGPYLLTNLLAVNCFWKRPHHKCWTVLSVKKKETNYIILHTFT